MLTEVSSPKKEGKASLKAHTQISDSYMQSTTQNYFGFGRLHCLMCQDDYLIFFYFLISASSGAKPVQFMHVQCKRSPLILCQKKEEKGGGEKHSIISSLRLPKT